MRRMRAASKEAGSSHRIAGFVRCSTAHFSMSSAVSSPSSPLLAQFDALWESLFPPPLPSFGATSLSATSLPTPAQIAAQPVLKLLSTICSNVLASPQLSKFRHLARAKVAPKLGAGGMAMLEAIGFADAPDHSGEMVLPPEADLAPLRALQADMQRRSEEARQRERERRGYAAADDVSPSNKAAASAAAASSSAASIAAASSPAAAAPLDSKSLTDELEWTRARLEKVRASLAGMARLQLTGESSKNAFHYSSHSWSGWLDQLWTLNAPVSRDQAVSTILPILTNIIREPSNERLRTFAIESKLPFLNAAQGAAQLMQSLGFVMGEHTLSLPASADLSEWPAVLVALRGRSVAVASDRDHGRKRGVEALASKAQATKAHKSASDTAATSSSAAAAATAAAAPASLESLQSELSSCERRLHSLCASTGFSAPFLIDVSVLDWSSKESHATRRFESAPAMVDGSGRKWRAFAIKGGGGVVSLFLEMISTKLPAGVSAVPVVASFSALHHASHIPCFRPAVHSALYVSRLEFSATAPVLGYARFATQKELECIGAHQPQSDKLTLRVEFSVGAPVLAEGATAPGEPSPYQIIKMD